jgi:hypothetical protein
MAGSLGSECSGISKSNDRAMPSAYRKPLKMNIFLNVLDCQDCDSVANTTRGGVSK